MQDHIVLKASDCYSVTISNTTTALTVPDSDVVNAILSVGGADVRMRWDGSDPAAGARGGILMADGTTWEIGSRDILTAMRFFRNASTDAAIFVAYMVGE